MQVPKAPNLWWSIGAYYALAALVGAVFSHAHRDESSVADLLTGLAFLPILGTLGFIAPFVVGDWVSWTVVISAIAGMIFAWLKLRGWSRWIVVMLAIVGVNAYGLHSTLTAAA